MSKEKFVLSNFTQSWITPILILATTILGILNNYKTGILESQAKVIQNTIDSLTVIEMEKDLKFRDITFQREFKFKI